MVNIGSKKWSGKFPSYCTPIVGYGGFPTGDLKAGGPIQAWEARLFSDCFPDQGEVVSQLDRCDVRHKLNVYFMYSVNGRKMLSRAFEKRCFHMEVPEDLAAMAVNLLRSREHIAAADRLTEELTPMFSYVRFYPQMTPETVPGLEQQLENGVQSVLDMKTSVASVQDVIYTLEEMLTPKTSCRRQQPARKAWSVDTGAQLYAGLAKVASVVFDNTTYTDGKEQWEEFQKYEEERKKDREILFGVGLPRKMRSKGGYATLRDAVSKHFNGVPYHIGRVKQVLSVLQKRQQQQQKQESCSICKDIVLPATRVVLHRLRPYNKSPALSGQVVEELLKPIQKEEAGELDGAGIPNKVANIVKRALLSRLCDLLQSGSVSSPEEMSRLVRGMAVSAVCGSCTSDKEVSTLLKFIGIAFRKGRRSLMLLNHEKQETLFDLPWFHEVVRAFGIRNNNRKEDAYVKARAIVEAYLRYFCGRGLNNVLIGELQELLPELKINKEIAADIFMGSFSKNFENASLAAAEILFGTPYEAYYLPFLEKMSGGTISDKETAGAMMRVLEDPPFFRLVRCSIVASSWKPKVFFDVNVTSNACKYTDVCWHLSSSGKSSCYFNTVAENGACIETHKMFVGENLPVLIHELGLGADSDLLEEAMMQALRRLCTCLSSQQPLRDKATDGAVAVRNALVCASFLERAPDGDGASRALKALRTVRDNEAIKVRNANGYLPGLEKVLDDIESALTRHGDIMPLLGWNRNHSWLNYRHSF